MKSASYDDDEIMIFSGKLADEVMTKTGISNKFYDECRNAAAESAENVMRGWRGIASVPLPHELLASMTEEATNEIAITHSKLLKK